MRLLFDFFLHPYLMHRNDMPVQLTAYPLMRYLNTGIILASLRTLQKETPTKVGATDGSPNPP